MIGFYITCIFCSDFWKFERMYELIRFRYFDTEPEARSWMVLD